MFEGVIELRGGHKCLASLEVEKFLQWLDERQNFWLAIPGTEFTTDEMYQLNQMCMIILDTHDGTQIGYIDGHHFYPKPNANYWVDKMCQINVRVHTRETIIPGLKQNRKYRTFDASPIVREFLKNECIRPPWGRDNTGPSLIELGIHHVLLSLLQRLRAFNFDEVYSNQRKIGKDVICLDRKEKTERGVVSTTTNTKKRNYQQKTDRREDDYHYDFIPERIELWNRAMSFHGETELIESDDTIDLLKLTEPKHRPKMGAN